MPSLSSKLYDLVRSSSEQDVCLEDKSTFLWIWYWLYLEQPSLMLQETLMNIDTFVGNARLDAQTSLELAWKAEALERLLEAH